MSSIATLVASSPTDQQQAVTKAVLSAMSDSNPFESPQSEVAPTKAPALSAGARVARAVLLGALGYAIWVGTIYFAYDYFDSSGHIPNDAWVRGLFVVITFAGSELFVNSHGRSMIRRLAYAMLTIFFSAIVADTLSNVLPETAFYPHRSQAAEDQVQNVLVKVGICTLAFLVFATMLNRWRSRRKGPQVSTRHELELEK